MEKSALNSKRILYLDAISGIFILRMIYAHCCAASSVTNHDIIFLMTGLFLMWFFFKGGLLYSDKKKNIIRSSSRKLLKPFICFTAIGYGMDIAMYMIDKYIANFGGGTTLRMR
jgi:fucose 4-O-acetylase-like acetyltransferase